MATKTKTMAPKIRTKDPAKSAQCASRWVIVGPVAMKVPAGVTVCLSTADLPTFVRQAPRKGGFISSGRIWTDDLLQASLKLDRGARMGNLLTLEPPRPESVPSLSGFFERVIGANVAYRWLPVEELATVLSGKDVAGRFIGGAVDAKGKTIALVRGNLSTLVVPFAYFKVAGDGTKPDFSKLALADYGVTVALGDYEASADGILYELDPLYRKKMKKERLQTEQTFGASLRRLRVQRGMKRGDFAPVASKTIARIERGDVGKPHGKTLETIVQRLGVSADQIESF